MAADWTLPINTTIYSNVLTQLNGKILSSAKMDYGSDTNIPTGAVRWGTTNKDWETWNGSAWVLLNDWTSFVSTYGGTGAMTFTSVTQTLFKYKRSGNEIRFVMSAVGTTGGTASNGISFTVPFAMSAAGIYFAFAANVNDASFDDARAYAASSTAVVVEKEDGSNYGLGAGRRIYVTGNYEI